MNIVENSKSEYPLSRVELDIYELVVDMRGKGFVVSFASGISEAISVSIWQSRDAFDIWYKQTITRKGDVDILYAITDRDYPRLYDDLMLIYTKKGEV